MRILTEKSPFVIISLSGLLALANGLLPVAYASDDDSSSSESYCDCSVSADDSSSSDDKVTICHKPGSLDEHTIHVSIHAQSAHLGHGDTLGLCASDTVVDTLVETGTPCTCPDGSTGHWYGPNPSAETADQLREVLGQ